MAFTWAVHLKSILSSVLAQHSARCATASVVSGVAFTCCTGRRQGHIPSLQPTGNSYQPSLPSPPGKALGSKSIPEEAAIDQGKSHAVRYAASAW